MKWILHRKLVIQLITYYDETIGYFLNSMVQKLVDLEWTFEVVIEATILQFCTLWHMIKDCLPILRIKTTTKFDMA